MGEGKSAIVFVIVSTRIAKSPHGHAEVFFIDRRVLLQMSATDSSNLIDSPAASTLGVNRAVFYNDERGEYEKFRPYGLPSDEWLARVRQTLGDRFRRTAAQATTLPG